MARTASRLATELGAILRGARGDRPLKPFADDVGYSRNTLYELERGTRGDGEPANPTLARVERIAEAYGVRLTLVAEPVDHAQP